MTAHRFAAIAACTAALCAGSAPAQQVYRIVGPDGKVSFSDRAPDSQIPVQAIGSTQPSAGQGGSTSAALPYALRQVATRYPVTLYTNADCPPCASARSLLLARGVPFQERTVQSGDDIEALKRLAGQASVPFATIGGQQLHGFAPPEWTQYLDLAGYPKQSELPPGYRNPSPMPLVPVAEKKAPDAASPPPTAPSTPLPAPGPTPSNPAGIVF